MQRRLFGIASNNQLRSELATLLERQKFERVHAEQIVDTIDSTIKQAIHRRSSHFLAVPEYDRIIQTIHQTIDLHRQEIQQMEATTTAALATDYDFLLGEIARARDRLRDEATSVQSNVQLDLNLERKRRAELIGEVEGKGLVANRFLEEKSQDIDRHLKQLARQAMTAIIALGTTMISTFIGYKIYTS